LDKLVVHKEALCLHLRQRLGELFAFEYDLLLYDVTSTYFEGLAAGNELAQRGYSRDHRPDCKQVCIALVVTREGMPLAYEVFAGNRVDVTTVESMVESVESKYGKVGRIWVMDRGMVSEKNLAFLRKRQSHYVVGTPKSLLRQLEAELKQKDWTEVEPGITVRLCAGPEDGETLLVCRSQARREKERAIQTRFARRIRAGVKSLERRLAAARQPVSRDEVQRQIGRLLGRNARAAAGFDLRVMADAGSRSGIRIQCLRRLSWWHGSRLSAGAYVLRSLAEDPATNANDVVGMGIVLGKNERLGQVGAPGEHLGKDFVAKRGEHGANLVRRDHVAVEVGGI
jgi:hypothetical protein